MTLLKLLFPIFILTLLSSCTVLRDFSAALEKPYEPQRAENLSVDPSFTYESIQEGKIAFLNLNFTAPMSGRGIDIDDEIGAPIPPYTYRFHQYLANHRPDIAWIGPRRVYGYLEREPYARMHEEFNDSSGKIIDWLKFFNNDPRPRARYFATADRTVNHYFTDTSSWEEAKARKITIKLDIYDAQTQKQVWSGEISYTRKQPERIYDELSFYSWIAREFVNNMPTSETQFPVK